MLRTSVSGAIQLVRMFRCYTDLLVVMLRRIVVYHCEQGYVQHACHIGTVPLDKAEGSHLQSSAAVKLAYMFIQDIHLQATSYSGAPPIWNCFILQCNHTSEV